MAEFVRAPFYRGLCVFGFPVAIRWHTLTVVDYCAFYCACFSRRRRPAEIAVQVHGYGVVLCGHRRRVTNPLADRGQTILLHQFAFPARPQVVEEFGPIGLLGLADDPLQLGAPVNAGVPAQDDVVTALGRFGEGIQQRLLKLREQRDGPYPAAAVVLRLTGSHHYPPLLKIYILPLQGQVLTRTAQATVAAEGKDQAPLGVGASLHYRIGHVTIHEVLAGLVGLLPGLHPLKDILRRKFPAHRLPPHRPCNNHPATDRRHRKLLIVDQPRPPVVRIRRRDVPHHPTSLEILLKVSPGVAVHHPRCLFARHCSEEPFQELAQRHLRQPDAIGQPHRPHPCKHHFIAAGQPLRKLCIVRTARQFVRDDCLNAGFPRLSDLHAHSAQPKHLPRPVGHKRELNPP